MEKSDVVIAVSNKIKHRLIHQYSIPEEKIRVVYNGAEFFSRAEGYTHELKGDDDIVLFAGRVTLQKGPDYFVEMARKVLDVKPNTKFIMAGTGDMLQHCIRRVAELGMTNKFLFPGFYTREEGDRMFQLADLFILPSVSEPFGIVPLEAMYNNTPAIISKQAGCSEVLNNCFKTDFWDIEDMAAKTIAALSYKKLNHFMKENGKKEVLTMGWDGPAQECINIYDQAISNKAINNKAVDEMGGRAAW